MRSAHVAPGLARTLAVCALLGFGTLIALAVLALDPMRSPVERARNSGGV